MQARSGVSPLATAAAVVVVAILVGAGGYYAGNTAAPTTTSTMTVSTAGAVVTSTSTSTISLPAIASTATSTITQTPTPQTITQTVTLTTTATLNLAVFGALKSPNPGGIVIPDLIALAAKDRGLYASNGLNPQFIGVPGVTAASYPGIISNGTQIGFGNAQDILVAKASGVPIKLVGTVAGSSPIFYASLSTSPYRTLADLNGKRVTSTAASASATLNAGDRIWNYVANKTGIHASYVYVGATANASLTALRSGTADVGQFNDAYTYTLVQSGELRLIAWAKDVLPQQWAAGSIWATDSLLQSNPSLVKAFVQANLQALTYLVKNPSYATTLLTQNRLSPSSAAVFFTVFSPTPNGAGSGNDLIAMASNVWQFGQQTGSIPANLSLNVGSAVNPYFLSYFPAAGNSIQQSIPGFTIVVGNDRGFYASNGINLQWVNTPALTASTYKSYIANGTQIGLGTASDILVARANGLPVRLLASVAGTSPVFIVVNASSSFKTMADLDGKKILLPSSATQAGISATDRIAQYMANKTGIHPTWVFNPSPSGNTTVTVNQALAALKGGSADAFVGGDPVSHSLVQSGSLRVIAYARDILPQPWAAGAIWATDSLIQQNPALVKAFVQANLQAVSYLVQNPSYATNLWASSFHVSSEVASAALIIFSPTPSGQGSGNNLAAAANNVWTVGKVAGSIPASATLDVNSAVDTEFLGG